MASQVFKRGPVKAEMNITPLIDVVFLLIVFFMLVNKIVSDESVPMRVPVLDDPQTREVGEVERVVVNVAPAEGSREDNALAWDGNAAFVQVGAGLRFNAGDLGGITSAVASAKATAEAGGAEGVEVILRADSALFYDAVQPVLDAITEAGVETVHLTAFLPDDGGVGEPLGEGGAGGGG
ncbi:MAG: biopolymer transporter ExbD [Planctomycetota bacterium]